MDKLLQNAVAILEKVENIKKELEAIKSEEEQLRYLKELANQQFYLAIRSLRKNRLIKIKDLHKLAGLSLTYASSKALLKTTFPRKIKIFKYLADRLGTAEISQILDSLITIENRINSLSQRKEKAFEDILSLMKFANVKQTRIASVLGISKQAVNFYLAGKQPWNGKNFYSFANSALKEATEQAYNKLYCREIWRQIVVWGIKYPRISPKLKLSSGHLGHLVRHGTLSKEQTKKLIKILQAYQKSLASKWSKTWYGKLRLYRCLSGLTVREVARKTGVSERSIYIWEAGHAKPARETLQKLLQLYGIKTNIFDKKQNSWEKYAKHQLDNNITKKVEEWVRNFNFGGIKEGQEADGQRADNMERASTLQVSEKNR